MTIGFEGTMRPRDAHHYIWTGNIVLQHFAWKCDSSVVAAAATSWLLHLLTQMTCAQHCVDDAAPCARHTKWVDCNAVTAWCIGCFELQHTPGSLSRFFNPPAMTARAGTARKQMLLPSHSQSDKKCSRRGDGNALQKVGGW